MMTLNFVPRDTNVNLGVVTEHLTVDKRNTVKLTPFHLPSESEVKRNPKKATKLVKLMSSTGSMFAALFLTTAPVTSGEILDPQLKSTILMVMAVVVTLSIAAAIIAAMLAGGWKMFFGGNQADAWSLNILKGFSQVLLAPVIIGIIVLLFSLLFGNLPFFEPVNEAVKAWLHN